MRYKAILFDFDDTLVDFHDAEVYAYGHLMKTYRVPKHLHDYNRFKTINQNHWEAFQRGEISKSEVLSHRFIETFDTYGMTVDGAEADVIFRDGLATAPIKWLEGMEWLLEKLYTRYALAIVTNGVTDTQERRIARTNLEEIMDYIFISDKVGVQKPHVGFFNSVFEMFPQYQKEDFLIVGDSLTSDIQGGLNAGIDTCWLNHRQLSNQTGIQPTYTIESTKALAELLL
ncbi:YjjG family noncanonical pyrimidine nucleotidase [Staphylococcus lutrae]|uniref:Noncanonical pyrimidine nucleotidase, YjjG family n=1 Tax=Staphylococcus lutrae TaxID=155085 RepID=A0AAC9WJQ2_9STAP|nr:YjjG family noncanonical pyrimidine nucleotidase [Staphylococcus lutrae]ARJ51599.1 noncanonical pyrimidine nucleotidase, YjjG family [Staphylococcus lutrae]PNZ36757.1 noncanonical pyrimidine nucleotidase, YjjG family [Staphylococcus lutrae]